MKKLKQIPKIPFGGAALFFALGLALLIWPDAVLTVFPPLLGGIIVLVGSLNVGHTLVMWQRVAQPGFKLLRGMVNIVVGLVFIAKRDVTLAFLSILFGLYVLIMAAIDFSDAMQNLRTQKRWGLTFFQAVAKLVLGLVLLFAPFSGRTLWVRVLGVYFMVIAGGTLHWLVTERRPAPPASAAGLADEAETQAEEEKEENPEAP